MENKYEKYTQYLPSWRRMSKTDKVLALFCAGAAGANFGGGKWVMGSLWTLLGLAVASISSSKAWTNEDTLKFLAKLEASSPETYKSLMGHLAGLRRPAKA